MVTHSPSSLCMVFTIHQRMGRSRANLAYLLEHYRKQGEYRIRVALQGEEMAGSEFGAAAGIEVLALHNPAQFNGAWGWNCAAHDVKSDVLIFLDNRTLVSAAAINKAAAVCRNQAGAANLFSRQRLLSPEETASLCKGRDQAAFESSEAIPVADFCQGGFAIRADLFRRLGGFDERLFHPPHALQRMAFKLERGASLLASFDNSTALGLDDGGEDAVTGDAATLPGAAECSAPTLSAFYFACEVQRQLMGNPHKYAALKRA